MGSMIEPARIPVLSTLLFIRIDHSLERILVSEVFETGSARPHDTGSDHRLGWFSPRGFFDFRSNDAGISEVGSVAERVFTFYGQQPSEFRRL